MSGLLQKDLCLLKSNRKTLVLFLALAVVISLGLFPVSYDYHADRNYFV